MKHVAPYSVWVLSVGVLVNLAVSPASAIRIRDARIQGGAVEIRGKDAQPNATITVDGKPAGLSTRRGGFKVTTTRLPSDCIVDVSDGVETAEAVIRYCGPAGPRGPAAPLTAYSATGEPLGILVGASAGSPATVTLYIEGVGKFVELWPVEGRIEGCTLLFESEDCSGQPYMHQYDMNPIIACSPYGILTVWAMAEVAPVPKEIRSESDELNCSTRDTTDNVYPVEAADLPFLLPVATPVTFRTE